MKKNKISINKILSYCILAILLIIICGTFIFFVSNLVKNSNENENQIESTKQIQNKNTLDFDSMDVYEKLGKIRTASKDGIPLVLSVYFPYDVNDREFYEELSVKNESIKACISGYFFNYSYDELKNKGENRIKSEVLNNINEKLVLSKISELYFVDFVFFD